ncbi:hypothetical protein Hanom_Chr03g00195141 [Helianthus anomalus]
MFKTKTWLQWWRKSCLTLSGGCRGGLELQGIDLDGWYKFEGLGISYCSSGCVRLYVYCLPFWCNFGPISFLLRCPLFDCCNCCVQNGVEKVTLDL